MHLQYFVFPLLLEFVLQVRTVPTRLRADGTTSAYTLINSIFGQGGSALEVPDCNHTEFGPHITQQFDTALNTHVFAFHLHIKPDDDRCSKFDRQRNEIKTNDGGSTKLVAYNNDRMSLLWAFKLDADFQPPYSFCHIHQLKAVGGDDSMPLITVTPRRSNPNELQLLQYDSKGGFFFLDSIPLQPLLGNWIVARSNVTFGHNGSYSLELRKLDGELLMNYRATDIDLWRNGSTYVRPKWGIYRSVQEAVLSRDETVLFADLCVGVGESEYC